jgi:pyruvate/2-oxoglutarate/acetoin dehydrogenase E1 component
MNMTVLNGTQVADAKPQSSAYFDALCSVMNTLSQDRRSIFVGQGVGCAGTTMTDTLRGVPSDKLLEFPVAEDLQMGFCTGLALEGRLPICIFPRWNFLICATNQIVNHLDKLVSYSRGEFNPRVLIRVAVPIVSPFYPGPQHDADFTGLFRDMLHNVRVVALQTPDSVEREYEKAANSPWSTILVEYTKLYGAIPSGVRS